MTKILYDGKIILNYLEKNGSRSGVFWVALNLLKELSKTNECFLYFDNLNNYIIYEKNKNIFQKILPNTPLMNLFDINMEKYSDYPELEKKYKILKKTNTNFILKIFYNLKRKYYKLKLKEIEKKLAFKVKLLDKIKNFDYFVSPFFEFPKNIKNSNIKKVLILHDTIPVIFPEYYNNFKINDNSDYSRIIQGLNKETYYFCVSLTTKNDFLRYFGTKIDKNKMFVMPIATSQNFCPDKNTKVLNKVLNKYNISKKEGDKYIFSLCTLEPRKNLIFTIKCFIEFIKKNNIDDLYFYIGGGHWNEFINILEKEIQDLDKYKNKIVKLGYVDDDDINVLYSNSLFFTYISLYEGFGMPPLEAMSCGTSVLTSNISSISEVVGDAAIKINPKDKKACVKEMENLYFSENLRNELIEKGLEQAEKFKWERSISIIMNNLDS